MQEKDNYLKTAELSTEQNYNMIDGIPNNAPMPPPVPVPEIPPLDRVKEPPAKRRSREGIVRAALKKMEENAIYLSMNKDIIAEQEVIPNGQQK